MRLASSVRTPVFLALCALGGCATDTGASHYAHRDPALNTYPQFEADHAACEAQEYQRYNDPYLTAPGDYIDVCLRTKGWRRVR